MANLFGYTAAGVGGYSMPGNLFAIHLARKAPLVGAFHAASESGGTLSHHQVCNTGTCVGVPRGMASGMFHKRAGGMAMGGGAVDGLRRIFGHSRGLWKSQSMGDKRGAHEMPMGAPAPKRPMMERL